MYNLLTQPLLQTTPGGLLTLPGLIAAMARDEIATFPALRPHQEPAWHMFLVQLAALAIHKAEHTEIPTSETEWLTLLRGLTSDFENDEPWHLIVNDHTQPAFLQPPVPLEATLKNHIPTPDALDLLITSRNHDLKQTVARSAQPQDWLLALISLQTSEGYGGAGNHGIARMNGGSSSRPLLGLAPLPAELGSKALHPRAGSWFRRDLQMLIQTREQELATCGLYPAQGGIGLTWLVPWPENEQLQIGQLDIWFIEVCRRVRLQEANGVLTACGGTSKTPRIAAKPFKGNLNDPWAPVKRTESKSFTLAEGDFDYRTLITLLFTGDWRPLPLLARPASFEDEKTPLVLMVAALARGNSKTSGFKSRCLPLGGKNAHALMNYRQELHELAQEQAEEIAKFDEAIRGGLALAAAGGEWQKRRKEHYAHARAARNSFNRAVDTVFFPSLWSRHEAQEKGPEQLQQEKQRFKEILHEHATRVFTSALPAIPCPGIFRPRAEIRARQAFNGTIRKYFDELFSPPATEETDHAPA